jgi:predicted alpha/beta hydrolase family esterase
MNTKSVIQIAEVVNGVVHITLPKDFHAKRVELTIVPLENDETQLSAFQQFLLDSPEMTDDEYLTIEEKRRHLQKWK